MVRREPGPPWRHSGWLKRGTLLFWALWLSVVCLTNLFDALKALGWLGPGWAFASGNFDFIVKATAIYDPAPVVNGVLFAGVIAWEGVSAALFWAAWRSFGAGATRRPGVLWTAFTVSLALWAAFMLADELTFQFAIEATHMRIFIAQLATLLALHLLPDSE